MKKYGIFLFFLLFLVLCGCRPTVSEYGIEYEALTDKEHEALILLARATLAHNTKRGIITEEESRIAQKQEPEFRIHYYGDRQGSAKVSWDFPTRRISIAFDGEFLKPQMQYNMQIQEKGPALIDTRKKQPTPKPRKQEDKQKKTWYRNIVAP